MADIASRAPRRVRMAGLAILAAGLVAAAVAHFNATAARDVDAGEQRREMNEVARLGGTATVQTVKFDAWLSSLWEGGNLAWTLAVLAGVAGGACWYVGGLMAEEVDAAPRRR